MNYHIHYNNLITRAQNRIINGYKEIHHIVPRCLGGTDDISNLVDLTPEEHFVAHQLLIKINPGVDKLVYAVTVMSGRKKNRMCKQNKLYGWLKRKLSETRKGKPGKKQSQETIDKRANSNRGKKRTIETKERMSAAQIGREGTKHTEETKKKISNTLTEQYRSGQRISYVLGRHHSEEHKQKMSDMFKGRPGLPSTQKGIPKSAETKQKMSASKKGKKRDNFVPWNKGVPMTDEAKQNMGKKNSDNLKGRTWEDIYGIEGAAKRRERLAAKRLAKLEVTD